MAIPRHSESVLFFGLGVAAASVVTVLAASQSFIVEFESEFWSAKLTDWLLALFTFALVMFTQRLYRATVELREVADLQRADMLRSISATEHLAAATRQSANALVRVDLPIVFIQSIELTAPLNRLQGWMKDQFPPQESALRLVFRNFGRTHAVVTRVCWECQIAIKLPPEPGYENIYPVTSGTVIKPNDVFPFHMQHRIIQMSNRDLDELANFEKYLWVYGYIEFRDFMGDIHKTGFCANYMLQFSLDGGGPIPSFYVGDLPQYTYQL